MSADADGEPVGGTARKSYFGRVKVGRRFCEPGGGRESGRIAAGSSGLTGPHGPQGHFRPMLVCAPGCPAASRPTLVAIMPLSGPRVLGLRAPNLGAVR